jgi:hypothetical protein
MAHPVFKFFSVLWAKYSAAGIPQAFDDVDDIDNNGQLCFLFIGDAV